MNLNNFDMNLLRVLDALLREGSTVRAGVRLGLSQPAVSSALKRLRIAFDDPLFVRHGKGLVPTDFAKAIEFPLHQILDQTESLLTVAKNFDPLISDRVFRISGSDFFSEMLLPQLANRVAQCAPNMRIQLVDLVPDNYVDTLDKYAIDIALIPNMNFPDWVETKSVFRSSYAVIARKDHPKFRSPKIGAGQAIPMKLFCDLGHLLMSPEGKLKSAVDTKLAQLGHERNVVMTMPFFSGVYRAVSESDLIALIPQKLADHVAERMGLEIYQPPMPVRPELLKMAWHKRSASNPAHRWLRDQIAELLLPLNENEDPLH